MMEAYFRATKVHSKIPYSLIEGTLFLKVLSTSKNILLENLLMKSFYVGLNFQFHLQRSSKYFVVFISSFVSVFL